MERKDLTNKIVNGGLLILFIGGSSFFAYNLREKLKSIRQEKETSRIQAEQEAVKADYFAEIPM
ncbi:hypothetical protein HYW74_04100 [Candidatus Pacearchaeota archaeon]|nr:hypothetical protein [Candidatus Pacearchaeota archaeon]